MMRYRTTNRNDSAFSGRRENDALRLAVRLVVAQLSNGIDLREAVQFAAKYHDVTCASIDAALPRNISKGRPPSALS